MKIVQIFIVSMDFIKLELFGLDLYAKYDHHLKRRSTKRYHTKTKTVVFSSISFRAFFMANIAAESRSSVNNVTDRLFAEYLGWRIYFPDTGNVCNSMSLHLR